MLEQLSAGVVLTGGAVLLQGMREFAEEILGMPVRVATPIGIKGITQLVCGPEFATGVGLVRYGAQAIAEAAARAAPERAMAGALRGRMPPAAEIPSPTKWATVLEWVKAAF